MRQLKEKHATKYASLHSSLLYRKRIHVIVENYEGPLIVWAGVVGTEGLPRVIIAVSRHERGVPRACIGHRLMSKAHTITTPWYEFVDFYYVDPLQSRGPIKHTQIIQSPNMYTRHLLASSTIERSTSDLHCIFLERPARQRAKMRLRCGRGKHRRDSATCAYPGTRMQRPSYLVWTVNKTSHLSSKSSSAQIERTVCDAGRSRFIGI